MGLYLFLKRRVYKLYRHYKDVLIFISVLALVMMIMNLVQSNTQLQKFPSHSGKFPSKKNLQNSKLSDNDAEELIIAQDSSSIKRKYFVNSSAQSSNYLFNIEQIFQQWLGTKEYICGDNLIAYGHELAVAHNIILDTKYGSGRKGGEEIEDVLNQNEEAEYYQFNSGFFEMSCDKKLNYFFHSKSHLNSWYKSLEKTSSKPRYDILKNEFYIAVTRYEYVNIYHTMTDIYNCYIVMRLLNKTREESNVLLIDGHPKGSLDNMWKILFKSSDMIGNLNGRILYKNLAWGILGYDSKILKHTLTSIPLVEDFREFVLDSYKIDKNYKIDCEKVNVLFIWRRDYVAHPRNPSGKVSRKISNENSLMGNLSQIFPDWRISGVQLDNLDMKSQLKLISTTDILIGMHGAGLTHALFLPKHSALLEIIPKYWQRAKDHFQSIARWRHLIYQRWTNTDAKLETGDLISYVPPEVVKTMSHNVHKVMCK